MLSLINPDTQENIFKLLLDNLLISHPFSMPKEISVTKHLTAFKIKDENELPIGKLLQDFRKLQARTKDIYSITISGV